MTVFVFLQIKPLHITHVTEDSGNYYHRVIQKVARIDLEIPVHNHYRQTSAKGDLKKQNFGEVDMIHSSISPFLPTTWP